MSLRLPSRARLAVLLSILALVSTAAWFVAVVPADAVPASVRPLIEADGALRTWPHRHDADGFYAARLERTA